MEGYFLLMNKNTQYFKKLAFPNFIYLFSGMPIKILRSIHGMKKEKRFRIANTRIKLEIDTT